MLLPHPDDKRKRVYALCSITGDKGGKVSIVDLTDEIVIDISDKNSIAYCEDILRRAKLSYVIKSPIILISVCDRKLGQYGEHDLWESFSEFNRSDYRWVQIPIPD